MSNRHLTNERHLQRAHFFSVRIEIVLEEFLVHSASCHQRLIINQRELPRHGAQQALQEASGGEKFSRHGLHPITIPFCTAFTKLYKHLRKVAIEIRSLLSR